MNETPGLQLDPRTTDNKMYVVETSRPLGTIIYFTSEGDDPNSQSSVGGGENLSILHNVGDAMTQSKYIDLNVKENKTYIHEGYVTWSDAIFDTLTLSVVTKVSTIEDGTNTNFNLYGPLIIPANGNGNKNVTSMNLVEMSIGIDLGNRQPAFWNADYDTVTHQFSNVSAAPSGNGQYNMFASEVPLSRFVNNILLLKDGFIMLQTAETSEIGHGMRIKLVIKTVGEDHTWRAACILALHRVKTY